MVRVVGSQRLPRCATLEAPTFFIKDKNSTKVRNRTTTGIGKLPHTHHHSSQSPGHDHEFMSIRNKPHKLKRYTRHNGLLVVILSCISLLLTLKYNDISILTRLGLKRKYVRSRLNSKKFLYIYDVPNKFTVDLLSQNKFELIPGTKYAQWQTEYYIHQLFRESAYVTKDPEEATIFFVPLYGSGMRSTNGQRSEIWDNVILWLNEQMSNSMVSFLERHSGTDHAFVFGASRSWCKVSQPLLKVPKCLGLSHESLFGSNFIKLTVEFTGLRQEHLETPYLREKLSRIIVIPYMHYDVKSAFGIKFFDSDFESPKTGIRENLLYFSGSLLPKTAPFRAIFKQVCDSFSECVFSKTSRRTLNASHALLNLQSSTFCAILGGDTRASKRFFDAVSALCIPVIFDPLLALPFMDSIPYDSFVVRAPFIRNENIIRNTVMKLGKIREQKVIEMQSAMKSYVALLSYFSSESINAIDMIIQRLYIRGEKIRQIRHETKGEAELVHDGLQDWIVLEKNFCGSFGTASCKAYTQSVL